MNMFKRVVSLVTVITFIFSLGPLPSAMALRQDTEGKGVDDVVEALKATAPVTALKSAGEDAVRIQAQIKNIDEQLERLRADETWYELGADDEERPIEDRQKLATIRGQTSALLLEKERLASQLWQISGTSAAPATDVEAKGTGDFGKPERTAGPMHPYDAYRVAGGQLDLQGWSRMSSNEQRAAMERIEEKTPGVEPQVGRKPVQPSGYNLYVQLMKQAGRTPIIDYPGWLNAGRAEQQRLLANAEGKATGRSVLLLGDAIDLQVFIEASALEHSVTDINIEALPEASEEVISSYDLAVRITEAGIYQLVEAGAVTFESSNVDDIKAEIDTWV